MDFVMECAIIFLKGSLGCVVVSFVLLLLFVVMIIIGLSIDSFLD